LLNLYHILGLRTLFPFHNFKFDLLTLLQTVKAFTRDIAVMDKDVGPVFLGNKSVSFGIAEPFNLASYSHGTLTSENPARQDQCREKKKGTTESVPFRKGL
jgi:hypothetical protein